MKGEAYKGELSGYLAAFYNDDLSTPMLLEVLSNAFDGWNKMNGTDLDRHDTVISCLESRSSSQQDRQ